MTSERPLAADTDLATERHQFAIWSRMSADEKFEVFGQLMMMADALADAGIRLQHPEADDREVFLRRAARSLDAATMLKVYGWVPRTCN